MKPLRDTMYCPNHFRRFLCYFLFCLFLASFMTSNAQAYTIYTSISIDYTPLEGLSTPALELYCQLGQDKIVETFFHNDDNGRNSITRTTSSYTSVGPGQSIVPLSMFGLYYMSYSDSGEAYPLLADPNQTLPYNPNPLGLPAPNLKIDLVNYWESYSVVSNPILFFISDHLDPVATMRVKTWEEESTPVPEPSTMILLCGGLAGLAFWKKRKAEK